MKRIKIILCVIFSAAVLLSFLFIPAMAAENSGEFVVENGMLIKYLGSASKVIVPDDLGITSIGDSAFYDCYRLEEITIPKGVISIGKSAFSDCEKLSSVFLPDTLTMIADRAFNNCARLTQVKIPGKVVSIGDYAFNNCNILSFISIPKSVTSIGYQAFGGCPNLISITIPDSVTEIGGSLLIGSGITTPVIAKNGQILCFVPTSLESYKIPGSVKKINGGAFSGCSNMASLAIPDSVTEIGNMAFYGCSRLTGVQIPDSVTEIGKDAFFGTGIESPVLIDNGKTLSYVPPDFTVYDIPQTVTKIGASAFSNCNKLISIKLPDGVTSVGDMAFHYCSSLNSIEIPNSVTSIGYASFELCGSLSSVILHDGLTFIGDYAFESCENLTSVKIPESVTSIGGYAFAGCKNMTSALIPGSVKTIGEGAFFGTDISEPLLINSGETLCYVPVGFTGYSVPDTVKSIHNMAFYGCAVSSVNIPASVTAIGGYAFWDCKKLTSVFIPDSVTEIGDSAFIGCTGLKSVSLPNGITAIRDSTFVGCENLTSVKIPDGVKEIGKYAFCNCFNLRSVTIPDSVKSIGDSAFGCCSNLTSISIPSGVTVIGNDTFGSCGSLLSVTLPNGVTAIGDGAFECDICLKSIAIPDSVTVIGNAAFYECTSLQSITIPKSVTSIGNNAFSYCSNLPSVVIPGSVKTIGGYAFSECGKLSSVTIPESVISIGGAVFDNCKDVAIHGMAGSYAELYANSNKIPFQSILTAAPKQSILFVDGKKVILPSYAINGSNYFKLRDIAMALSGTDAQFDVTFDGASNEIRIVSDTAYSKAGGELIFTEDAGSRAAALTTSKIYINNPYNELGCTAYNIDDNNYLRLSDLAQALDFYMANSGANAIEVDTLAGYSVSGNKIYHSNNIWLSDEPVSGAKSTILADIDGDGKIESAEIVVSSDSEKKWTLVYQDGESKASVRVFEGNEYGFSTSVSAGHMISEKSIDFLVSSNLMSMPFGGASYELYSLKDGNFTKTDLSDITDGAVFDISVDEDRKTAQIDINRSKTTVDLSDMALSDYKLYGKEFCQDFFVDMKLQSAEGRTLPDLVTTEVIAAVLPDRLTYFHTTYRYINGDWKIQKVEFFDPSMTKENMADTWANAWRTRDGKPRYEIMSSSMQSEFRAQQKDINGNADNFVIRWSSPWVDDYDIKMEDGQAVITYWYTDSTGSKYKGVERLTFGEENGRTVVTSCTTEIEMQEVTNEEQPNEIPPSFSERKLYNQKLPVLDESQVTQIICEGQINGVTQGFYRSIKGETNSYLSLGGIKYDLGYVGYGTGDEYVDMVKSCGMSLTKIHSKTPVYQQTKILGAAAATTSYLTIKDNIPYLLCDMPGIGGQYDIDGDGAAETPFQIPAPPLFVEDVLYEWHIEAGYVGLLPLTEALNCDSACYKADEKPVLYL